MRSSEVAEVALSPRSVHVSQVDLAKGSVAKGPCEGLRDRLSSMAYRERKTLWSLLKLVRKPINLKSLSGVLLHYE